MARRKGCVLTKCLGLKCKAGFFLSPDPTRVKFCKRCRKRLDYLNRETVHLVALKAPETDTDA